MCACQVTKLQVDKQSLKRHGMHSGSGTEQGYLMRVVLV